MADRCAAARERASRSLLHKLVGNFSLPFTKTVKKESPSAPLFLLAVEDEIILAAKVAMPIKSRPNILCLLEKGGPGCLGGRRVMFIC